MSLERLSGRRDSNSETVKICDFVTVSRMREKRQNQRFLVFRHPRPAACKQV